MNAPSEKTPPNLVARTGSIPVRDDAEVSQIVENPSIATSKLFQGIATPTENRPQSSPKSGPTVKRHQSNQSVGTPPNFIRAVEVKLGLRCAWDLAANASNTKSDRFYDKEMNSLIQPWHTISAPGGFLRLNPEFNEIPLWAEKCALESAIAGCAPIVMLTPSSIGTNWFRDHIFRKAMVISLNGRLTFVGSNDPYPKDLMFSIYRLGLPGFDVWTLPKEAKQ